MIRLGRHFASAKLRSIRLAKPPWRGRRDERPTEEDLAGLDLAPRPPGNPLGDGPETGDPPPQYPGDEEPAWSQERFGEARGGSNRDAVPPSELLGPGEDDVYQGGLEPGPISSGSSTRP